MEQVAVAGRKIEKAASEASIKALEKLDPRGTRHMIGWGAGRNVSIKAEEMGRKAVRLENAGQVGAIKEAMIAIKKETKEKIESVLEKFKNMPLEELKKMSLKEIWSY